MKQKEVVWEDWWKKWMKLKSMMNNTNFIDYVFFIIFLFLKTCEKNMSLLSGILRYITGKSNWNNPRKGCPFWKMCFSIESKLSIFSMKQTINGKLKRFKKYQNFIFCIIDSVVKNEVFHLFSFQIFPIKMWWILFDYKIDEFI